MYRVILLALSLSFSLSSFAGVITCTGKDSKTNIILENTDEFGMISSFDYSFNDKAIKTVVNEAGISTNLEQKTEKLVVKFVVAKRHNKIAKKSTLALIIQQASDRSRGVITFFKLKEINESKLALVQGDSILVIDSLICH